MLSCPLNCWGVVNKSVRSFWLPTRLVFRQNLPVKTLLLRICKKKKVLFLFRLWCSLTTFFELGEKIKEEDRQGRHKTNRKQKLYHLQKEKNILIPFYFASVTQQTRTFSLVSSWKSIVLALKTGKLLQYSVTVFVKKYFSISFWNLLL